jgi:hypothetical protein
VQVTCNLLLVQCEACAERYANCCTPSCREIHVLPEDAQRAWRKGRATTSTKTKAISDPAALRARIREEEAALAASHEPRATSLTGPKLEARGSQLEAAFKS